MICHRRTPVVIFFKLSNGEDYVSEHAMHKMCRSVASQGFVTSTVAPFSGPTDYASARRPMSFHAISFGEESSSSSLRRMVQIVLEIQNDHLASDPLYPAGGNVPSSYTKALDNLKVRLAVSLLGIAESL
ncbi:hypothetical protein V8E53_008004 [Lactarius tabidus]